jgi:hypothetical protein
MCIFDQEGVSLQVDRFIIPQPCPFPLRQIRRWNLFDGILALPGNIPSFSAWDEASLTLNPIQN